MKCFNLLIKSTTEDPVQMIITPMNTTITIQSSITSHMPFFEPIAFRCRNAGTNCDTMTPVRLPSTHEESHSVMR